MDLAALRWWALLLLLVVVPAHAVVYVKVATQYYIDGGGGNKADTAGAYCANYGSQRGAGVVGSAVNVHEHTNGQMITDCKLVGGAYGTAGTVVSTAGVGACLLGSPIPGGGGGCYDQKPACPTGSSADASGFCHETCPAFGSQVGSHGVVLSSNGSNFALCIGECVYAPDVSGRQSDGTWANWGPFTSLGVNCKGTEGGTGSPVPAVCPAAQCPGTVNGTSVCVPCGDVKSPPVTSGTTAPPVDAGSAPAGSTPGSSSTTEQTTCSGGQCTTTRTTVTVGSSGGQTSQTTTTTQPMGTFCSVNPGAAVCAAEKEEPSTWGGSCAGFSCGGDAVQCAIAREQHVRNCALFDQATDLSRVGTAAATGENPSDHPRNQVQNTTFALSSMLDSSPLFGGSGGCPADYAFSYGGQSLVIPFSQTCDVLHMVGAMWMGICYLVAATIVFYRR